MSISLKALKSLVVGIISLLLVLVNVPNSSAAPPSLVFPIIGSSNYSDDFNAPRSNGKHHATDIFADKKQKVVSASDGIIRFVPYPEPIYGFYISISGNDGYTYSYLHLNNDTSNTDDGKGGAMGAYAPDVQPGNPVKKGQLIGYVGDSGNAEDTAAHLHFEIYKDGKAINPYTYLKSASKLSSPQLYPPLPIEDLPYGNKSKVGVNVGIGKSSSNSTMTVTGPGVGGGPDVKMFDPAGTQISKFLAYDSNFRGGVDVAAGDVDGDGVDEIITGPGPTGGPDIRVFEQNGTNIGQFFAYDAPNRDGVHVTAGDVDGDGVDEIITGPRRGSSSHVKVFKKDGTLVYQFFAYDRFFRGGIDVTAGDVDADGIDEIVTGPGPSGGPDVKIFEPNGQFIRQFFAYDKANRSGVRVSVGDAIGNINNEIVTVPASDGGAEVRIFSTGGSLLTKNNFLERWWRGGYDVAAGYSNVKATNGENSRRATLRNGL